MVNNDTDTQDTLVPPTLDFADFSLMLQTIDVFAQRGNLRGDELTPLGKLRDKVFQFVSAAQAQAQKLKDAEAGATE